MHDSIEEIKEVTNPKIKVLGVIATMYESRIKTDQEMLQLLEKENNVIGVVKRRADAKRGVYDGLSAVEQSPRNDIATEYNKICDYIIEKGR